ncbi:hypothetical protein EA472_13770 [Natrarchaeobius oligotrophus]|uniref:Uncharacterized protein n=1 Tax=Natrarchaeobius chitinivorans TaxID=1679083 RepID=A0A3N6MB03_NATCH|nr:hypothetical protein EA472_13770 [Natrarchaeobius chitinivorans]
MVPGAGLSSGRAVGAPPRLEGGASSLGGEPGRWWASDRTPRDEREHGLERRLTDQRVVPVQPALAFAERPPSRGRSSVRGRG